MRNYRHIIFCALLGIGLIVTAILTTPYVQSKLSPESNFDAAIKVVLMHEGGLTNSPNDPGSWTKYGVSLRFLKQSHIDPNGDGVENSADIIHLTLAKRIIFITINFG